MSSPSTFRRFSRAFVSLGGLLAKREEEVKKVNEGGPKK